MWQIAGRAALESGRRRGHFLIYYQNGLNTEAKGGM
jgi:hypothetical protein